MAKRKTNRECFDLGHKCGAWEVFEAIVSEYGEDIIDELLPVAEQFNLTEEDLNRILDDDGAPEDWYYGERPWKISEISDEENRENDGDMTMEELLSRSPQLYPVEYVDADADEDELIARDEGRGEEA